MTEVVDVNATPAQAWEVISDFATHAYWGGITGEWTGLAKPGLWLRSSLITPEQQKFHLLIHVIRAIPERELFVNFQGYRSPSERIVTSTCYTTYHWLIEPVSANACRIHTSIGTAGIIGKLLEWLVKRWAQQHKGKADTGNPETLASLSRLKAYIEEQVAG